MKGESFVKSSVKTASGLLLAIFIAFGFVACDAYGRRGDNGFVLDWSAENPFYGETLTLGVVHQVFNYEAFARAYMRINPGVTIEIINYGRFYNFNEEEITTQVGVQMMTGTAPDLIYGALVDHRNPNTIQLLSDWFSVMNAHPGFFEDEWDMNAFNAMSADGRLYAFTSDYVFRYVVANSQIPGLVEAFSQHDSISLVDMIEMHRQFAPQDGSMFLLSEMDVSHAVRANLHYFLDLESGVASFDNREFIDLITWARDNTPPMSIRRHLQVEDFSDGMGNREAELFLSPHYLFRYIPNYFVEYFSVFETDTIFLNPLPLVSVDGELLTWSEHNYVLNAGATPTQQLLALDFMMFMRNPGDISLWMSNPRYIGFVSTNNSYLRFRAEHRFPNMMTQNFTGPFAITPHQMSVSLEEAVNIFYDEKMQISEMPKTIWDFAPRVVFDALDEILGQFQDGLITAEQAANDLQNRLTLILMEM